MKLSQCFLGSPHEAGVEIAIPADHTIQGEQQESSRPGYGLKIPENTGINDKRKRVKVTVEGKSKLGQKGRGGKQNQRGLQRF